ncbi:MAG: hypothetical protein LBM08_04825, partial [Dysgonamonadaceae bacterium]|nr:hypothetical protein [Dysgonamonadaceae bacterium]
YRIRNTESETTTVTVIYDTITTPAPVSVAETGQVRAKLPDAELPVIELSIIDTLPAVTDSAEVVIPISTKVYEDSLYRAVISGYNVSLDTMQIYRNTVYVDHFREVTKMVRPGRWSVGLQVGYGTDFRGMRPYLGVGVSYKLFDF